VTMNAPFPKTINEIMRRISGIRTLPGRCCLTFRNVVATQALCARISREVANMPRLWQALMDELVLFPQGEHDDLFDGLQTMLEGATSGPTVRAYRYSPFQRF